MSRALLASIASVLLAACGGTIDDKTADATTDGNGADAAADGPIPTSVACGSSTCTGTDFCVVSCTGNPFYCDVPDDAGTCGAGSHLTTSCAYGPGAQLDGGGCNNAVYSYTCQARTTGETTYTCSSGSTMPIDANGQVTCCSD